MGIIATTVSIGVMMSAGLGISAMFKFLHSFELEVDKKPKQANNERTEREQRLHGQIKSGHK